MTFDRTVHVGVCTDICADAVRRDAIERRVVFDGDVGGCCMHARMHARTHARMHVCVDMSTHTCMHMQVTLADATKVAREAFGVGDKAATTRLRMFRPLDKVRLRSTMIDLGNSNRVRTRLLCLPRHYTRSIGDWKPFVHI